MFEETESKCSISGSFDKFKDLIDLTREEFEGLGVVVLAPGKGWLALPRRGVLPPAKIGFRPLPSEIGMSIKEIEDEFLRSVSASDFLYVVNPDGYIGTTVSLEVGYAVGKGVPVYALCPVDSGLDPDPFWQERLKEIRVMSPSQAAEDVKGLK
ncbi:MAG: hypothetical protein ABIB61_01120 [Candidatus Shapirobacteria bacterium]